MSLPLKTPYCRHFGGCPHAPRVSDYSVLLLVVSGLWMLSIWLPTGRVRSGVCDLHIQLSILLMDTTHSNITRVLKAL